MALSSAAAVRHFRAQLRPLGSPDRAERQKAYMKSALGFHGVTSAQLGVVCAAFCKENDLDASALRVVVDGLFSTDWFDLRSAAIDLIHRNRALLVPRDAAWLIALVRASPCWAHVDALATGAVDPLIAAHPSLLPRLRVWAKDRDFWVRRTALLGQLRALRGGSGDFALFAEIAEPMLDETEFFIRKAIGWVLREVSKKRPELVRDFLLRHGERASGVTTREAIKYLPPAMRRQLYAVSQGR
jgi:3-methyladenine DNA glycosylase AlkD